jgi:hypothetical protein
MSPYKNKAVKGGSLSEIIPLETNSYFALVVLEQWAGLCVKAGRMYEAYFLALKFAKLNLLISAPGTIIFFLEARLRSHERFMSEYPDEVERCFDRIGQTPSLCLSLYNQSFPQFSGREIQKCSTGLYVQQISRHHEASAKNGVTRRMPLDRSSSEYLTQYAPWHDKIHIVAPSVRSFLPYFWLCFNFILELDWLYSVSNGSRRGTR